MAIWSASHATAHRWLHSLPPRAPGEAPRATRWWMRWSEGTEWPPAAASALPRSLSCCTRKLVARRVLPGRAARRGKSLENALVGLPGKLLLPGPCCLAGARGASRQIPWSALVGLPGKLLLPGPCLLSLNTFVLEWLQGNHGGSWRSPGKPCRGVLQLPVQKFGVLGYPYSSTPTNIFIMYFSLLWQEYSDP